MMNKVSIDQLYIEVLQVQRAALIDTQTILQILLNKDICTLEEILETQESIKETHPDVRKLDDAILQAGGKLPDTQELANISINSKLKELQGLLNQLISDNPNLNLQ